MLPSAPQRRTTWIRCGAAACLWALLWLAPWSTPLAGWPYLRAWIAVLAFCVPGLGLDVLLRRSPALGIGERLPAAFAFSLALTSVLGLLGRLLGARLAVVDGAVLLAGALLVACAVRALPRPGGARAPRGSRQPVLVTAALALALFAGAALCTSPPIAADDFTHGARIAAFQQQPLGFDRLAFAGPTSITPRYWAALWPVSESLLAAKAGVAGLQLLALMAPLLAVLALLAVRNLALELGLSYALAVLAVLAQLAALALLGDRLQPGRAFFGRVGEDKFLAIFLLAPIACALLARYLARPSCRRLAAAGIAWVALAFTHPTSLGMAALVAILFCTFDLAARRARARAALLAIGLVIAATAPIAALRLVPHPQYRHLHFDVADSAAQGELTPGRTWRIAMSDGGFVGVAAQARPPALLAFGALVLAVAAWRWRQTVLARFVLASMLVPAIAVVPYTGWLLGRLVTPFHLWRTIGLVPFGLGAALLVQVIVAWCERRGWTAGRRLAYATTGIACAGLVALVSVGDARAARAMTSRLASWVTAATGDTIVTRCIGTRGRTTFAVADLQATRAVIDAATAARPVVLGDRCINDLLPSISARATLVTFRLPIEMLNHGDFTIDEATRVWDTQLALLDGKLPPAEAAHFLRTRGVDLIVLSKSSDWLDAIPQAMLQRTEIAANGPIRVYRIVPAATER